MCNTKVEVYLPSGNDYAPFTFTCGDIINNNGRTETVMCDACESAANKAYPQGWRYAPGDTCKHGVYVMGDQDCACWQCEQGD